MDYLRKKFDTWKRETLGRAPLSGEFLERYVRYMHESLLVTHHAQDLNVSHRAPIQDIHGDTHEIDVLLEYTIAGIRHRVVIECRDRTRPTSRAEVTAFCAMVADIPNAIGIFVAPRGYQSGARKYLDDRGVTHYDGTNLPSFGALVGAWFQPLALPDRNAIGQPFWAIMEAESGETTGTHIRVPVGTGRRARHEPDSAIPLFISPVDAAYFMETLWRSDTSVCVRGLERPALRALVAIADDAGVPVVMMTPMELDGRLQYRQELLSLEAVTERFLATPQ